MARILIAEDEEPLRLLVARALTMDGHAVYADQRERACGLESLIHDVIAKPFTVAAICTAVNDALAGRLTESHTGA